MTLAFSKPVVASSLTFTCCQMAVVPPVVPVVPVVGVTDVHVCASDGISLRMCEDNTSHPVEMPKLNLYPPDYKVVCFCK